MSEKMAAQLEEVECTQVQARSMKEVDDAVKESFVEEALSAKRQVINQMKELTNKYKKLNTTPVESNNIKFCPNKVESPQFDDLVEIGYAKSLKYCIHLGTHVKEDSHSSR